MINSSQVQTLTAAGKKAFFLLAAMIISTIQKMIIRANAPAVTQSIQFTGVSRFP